MASILEEISKDLPSKLKGNDLQASKVLMLINQNIDSLLKTLAAAARGGEDRTGTEQTRCWGREGWFGNTVGVSDFAPLFLFLGTLQKIKIDQVLTLRVSSTGALFFHCVLAVLTKPCHPVFRPVFHFL